MIIRVRSFRCLALSSHLLRLPCPQTTFNSILCIPRIVCNDHSFFHSLTLIVHGWINGHRNNQTYNATLRDLYDFSNYYKTHASSNQLALLFDTGDLTQGTGLSDATDVQGEFIFEMIKELDYDGLVIGNHEVYDNDCTDLIANDFHSHWNGTYVLLSRFPYLCNPFFLLVILAGMSSMQTLQKP